MKAVLLLIITDPWLMVVGSDSPSFALYEDGTTIYRGNKDCPFYSIKLSEQEKTELLNMLTPLKSMKNSYTLSFATDQPNSILLMRTPEIRKTIDVYGRIKSNGSSCTFSGQKEKPDILPDELEKVLAKLTDYSNSKGTAWLPENIEVMIWPFDYAKSTVEWPASWPKNSDKNVVKRRDSYTIYISNTEYTNLKSLMKETEGTKAVKWNGKKWAISYRFPIPDEKSFRGDKK